MCILTPATLAQAARVLDTLTQRERDIISIAWCNAEATESVARRNAIDPKLVMLGYAVCEYFSDCTADEMTAMHIAPAFAETHPMPLMPVLNAERSELRSELVQLRDSLG